MPDIGGTSACWERGVEGSADAAERLATEGRRRAAACPDAARVFAITVALACGVLGAVWLVSLP